MRINLIYFGLVLLAVGINASPTTLDSDGVDSNEDNGVVYVFDVYAIRNAKTATVGKMLNDGGIERIKSSAEKIGMIVMADEESDVPITLGEFSEIVEDLGMTVEKLNEEDELKIIEIKFEDMSMEDFDDFMSFEELIRILKAEGILLKLNEEHSTRFIQISFDEERKNPSDQPFTLEELAGFFEKEGYIVDIMKSGDKITEIRIHIDDIPDNEISKHSGTSSAKKDDKKIEKSEKKDDRFSTFDHITKSDSMNKIRRRRSPCPECKTGAFIKNMVEKYKESK